ncbi:MAG TPA: competence/damage-inducible protein A, partial [Chitinophagaceae bacterium]|nr:competence/damage-inducible protein A [Chitinophagaceae bacterium]
MKNIILISIGDELLNGDTLDTNAQWISEKLNNFPVKIHRKYTILDEKQPLIEILSQYVGKMDLILMTGGLGPTEDDKTQGILADFFKSKIIKNEEIYEKLKAYFIKRKGFYEEHNLDQAYVPDNAKIIPNNLGTASGTWFEKDGTIVISLPGVPFEMKDMMKKTVLPDLEKLWKTKEVKYTKHVWIVGIGESDLAKKI